MLWQNNTRNLHLGSRQRFIFYMKKANESLRLLKAGCRDNTFYGV